jgi:predicted O-linked N-acetylglucosamine transferase (SPINDLY family)
VLIAIDEPSYIRISVKLATGPNFRRQIGERILERMARSPRFINPPAYGKQLGDLVERLCSGGKMKRAVALEVAHR